MKHNILQHKRHFRQQLILGVLGFLLLACAPCTCCIRFSDFTVKQSKGVTGDMTDLMNEYMDEGTTCGAHMGEPYEECYSEDYAIKDVNKCSEDEYTVWYISIIQFGVLGNWRQAYGSADYYEFRLRRVDGEWTIIEALEYGYDAPNQEYHYRKLSC